MQFIVHAGMRHYARVTMQWMSVLPRGGWPARGVVPGGPTSPWLAASARAGLRTAGVLPTRERSAADLDRIEQTLRHGEVIPGSEQILADKGCNGPLRRVTLTYRGTNVVAVIKPKQAQAAQEEFCWSVARALGISGLVPAAVRRDDGSVYVEFVGGRILYKDGILGKQDIERVLRRGYETRHAGSDAAAAARRDRQLLQFFDYLIANSDRHRANGISDTGRGDIWFIDQGYIGSDLLMYYPERGPLRPMLRPAFQNGKAAPTVRLDPTTVEHIRQRLTPHTLQALHGMLQRPVEGLPEQERKDLDKLRSPAFLDGMRARLDQVLRHGSYDYVPRRDQYES
jgi:hypothetical protein